MSWKLPPVQWIDFVTPSSPLPGSGVGRSLGAGSPFSDYTASVVIYVLITGVLITGLLVGAFLIINLGLLSKRREDRIGARNPSDLRILKTGIWPEEPDDTSILPAEGDEQFSLIETYSEYELKTKAESIKLPPRRMRLRIIRSSQAKKTASR
jgi:hypothetical protein